MKNTTRIWTTAGMALLLCLTEAVAAETAGPVNVPLKTMSQAEYAAYRQQLGLQVNGVATVTPVQAAPTVAKESAPETQSEPAADGAVSGYGKGYRARMERSGSAGRGGGYRGGAMGGGAMSRGGGRN